MFAFLMHSIETARQLFSLLWRCADVHACMLRTVDPAELQLLCVQQRSARPWLVAEGGAGVLEDEAMGSLEAAAVVHPAGVSCFLLFLLPRVQNPYLARDREASGHRHAAGILGRFQLLTGNQ